MATLSDREQFIRDFRREVDDCLRFVTTNIEARHVHNEVQTRFSNLRQDLRRAIDGSLITSSERDELDAHLTGISRVITRHVNEEASNGQGSQGSAENFSSVRVPNGERGASKYNITKNQLEFLLACRFSQKQMASIFNVSTRTLSRRLSEFELRPEKYSDITDASLDETVERLLSNNRRIGANSVVVRLQNVGLRIQRERVRNAVRRVDPAGVALRSRRALKRRVYSVYGPNALWHLDGNHKLIRWRIVIHAAVDGYSRLITFMQASNNNRSSTVLAYFKKAVEEYGIPSRIRCDNGGENTEVCRFMLDHQGPGRGSAIRGRSVHNQRIERNWRDMWDGCINVYYDLFKSLEEEGLLNPNSEEQIFALHFAFLPHINHALQKFVNQWNHHKMRTEHSSTPVQMFVQRALQTQRSSSTASVGMWENANSEDNSQTASHTDEQGLSHVVVPTTQQPITEEQYRELCATVNPNSLEHLESLGIEFFVQTLHLLSNFLRM